MQMRERSRILCWMQRRRFALALLAAGGLLSASVSVAAAPAKTTPTPPPPVVAPAPPPNVSIEVTAPSVKSMWRMHLVNNGDVPVRVTADVRLLALDVLAPGAPVAQTVRCILPGDMRPDNDVDRALVLPPHRSYGESFDPRLYCFGAHQTESLVPGATVVVRYGWTPPALAVRRGTHAVTPPPPTPPFAVSPLEGVEPAVAPLKDIVSTALVIPADPVTPNPPVHTAAGGEGTDPFPTKLSVTSPAHVDSWSDSELSVPITVRNLGARSVTLLSGPETVGFDVIGPAGVFRCAWPTRPPAPIRELFTTLRPRGADTVSVLLSSICPDATFDYAGLFILRPRLDTRGAGGAPIGLLTFDGEVIGTTTTVLRIQHGRKRLVLDRPRLEPQ